MENYKKEIDWIVGWIKNYINFAKAKGVVLGLSGGVDSATVAALAVKALGRNNVLCLALPCNSPSAVIEARSAKLIVNHLKIIDNALIDLTSINKLITSEILYLTSPSNTLVEANIKARLRMMVLYAYANKLNYLVIGTTNRSEFEIGFFTKWGDGASDFEPLGQYYKTEVIELARELGLPEEVCTRTPSPGLQEGINDRDEIGMSYNKLDRVLKCISHEENWTDNNMIASDFVDIYNKINKNSHKKSMPPTCPRLKK